MRKVFAAILVLLFFAPTAWAAEVMARAEAMYEVGAFLNAAHLARTARTAEGDALAARATLAHLEFLALPEEKQDLLDRAEKDAELAMARNPDLAEGHLQYVVALGLMGRAEGTLQAHFNGYARDARALLDLVLEREPSNPWALALLGGWHLEIAASGTVGMALYGASVEAGQAACTEAQALAPSNATIAHQCALQLTALDWRTYGGAARAAVATYQRTATSPGDAFNQLSALRLEALDAALRRAEPREIEALLAEQTSFESQAAPTVRSRHQIRPPIGSPR